MKVQTARSWEPRMVAKSLAIAPIAALAVLAWTFADAHSRDIDWLGSCSGPPGMSSCSTIRDAWLIGSVLWSVMAATLTSLLLGGILSPRRFDLRNVPAKALAALAAGNLVMGVVMIPLGQLASYGRFPAPIMSTMLFLFVTLGLLLWGIGLIRFGGFSEPGGTAALIVTSAGGVSAMVLALGVVLAILNPPAM